MSDVSYVVLGGGLAGAKAVEALRRSGADGQIVLVGDETELPYERPELSKGYLAGDRTRGDLTVHQDGWYARHDVELLLGRRARAVRPGSRTVLLDDAERVGYDRLLLATGSRARRLGVPGEDLDGVWSLRRAADADQLRTAIAEGGPLVVVGGGWVGLEVAAVARAAGAEVTVVEAGEQPLGAMLGPGLGALFADLHREHGVTVLLGRRVVAIHGEGGVESLELDDGSTVEAAAVLVAVGIEPVTDLAAEAGLTVGDQGVVVDESLRTDDPRIWCAGDLALAANGWLGGPLRVEQARTAAEQGTLAGRSMAGEDAEWRSAPYFFSRQYGATMGYHGYCDVSTARLVVRQDPDQADAWSAYWLDDGRLCAALEVNVAAGASVRDLVVDRAPVDGERLADPGVPLPLVRSGT